MKIVLDKELILVGKLWGQDIPMRERTYRVEFIYTFNDMPQQIANYPFVKELITTRRVFIQFATMELSRLELNQLVKISCAIYYSSKPEIKTPSWYNDVSGKFFFEDGELIPDAKPAFIGKHKIK